MLIVEYFGDNSKGVKHFLDKERIPFKIEEKNTFKLVFESYPDDFKIIVPKKTPSDLNYFEWKDVEIPILQKSKEIEIGEKKVVLPFDIFSEFTNYITGRFEEFLKNREFSEKFSKIACLNYLEEFLVECLEIPLREIGMDFHSKLPYWPENKKFAICLTHDVDEIRKTYQYITWLVKSIKRRNLYYFKGQIQSMFDRIRGKEPFFTFPEIIKIEKDLEVRSSFYFLREKGKVDIKKPKTWKLLGRRYSLEELKETLLELDSEGFEIGLHGSYYSYENFSLLAEEKSELEDILGREIIGIRQHHLNLKIPKTWKIQRSAGLKYDTSLGFKSQAGFRAGTCFPFYPIDDFLEIPLIFMDTPYFMDEEKAKEELGKVYEEVKKHGGVLTLLFHHTVFNEKEFPGWVDIYKGVIKKAKEDGAWITTAGDICEWWKNRS